MAGPCVFITGASGYTGQFLVDEFLDARPSLPWRVHIGVRSPESLPASLTAAVSGVHAFDLESEPFMQRAFGDARPDVLIHAAAVASLADSEQDPAAALRLNAVCPPSPGSQRHVS